MSIKQVPYYQVECDEPGCDYSTFDTSSDYSAFGDQDGAQDDWGYGDHQSTEDGKHYCDSHRRPECADCGKTDGLINDEASGEHWCAEHLETTPEHEAPAGVVR
jgi:hypothetical protein